MPNQDLRPGCRISDREAILGSEAFRPASRAAAPAARKLNVIDLLGDLTGEPDDRGDEIAGRERLRQSHVGTEAAGHAKIVRRA